MAVKLLRIHYAFINWPDINQQQQRINRFVMFCSHDDPEIGSDGSRTAGEKQCEMHIITRQLLQAFQCQRSRVQLCSECKFMPHRNQIRHKKSNFICHTNVYFVNIIRIPHKENKNNNNTTHLT